MLFLLIFTQQNQMRSVGCNKFVNPALIMFIQRRPHTQTGEKPTRQWIT